jgi:signal transduction histidine kinase
MTDTATRRPPSTWPRAHLVYYLLASLDVVAILAGLALSHRIMQSFESALAASAHFERQLVSVRNLNDAATDAQSTAVDAVYAGNPGGLRSIFLTRMKDVKVEMERVRQSAALSFTGQALARLDTILARMGKALDGLEREALLASEEHAKGKTQAAFAALRQMQQRYVTLRANIRDINQLTSLARTGSLDSDRANIGTLRGFEMAIGGLIVLIIACVIFYGHYISRLMRRKYLELQAAFEASAKAEEEARAAGSELIRVNDDISRLNRELSDNLRSLNEAQDEIVRRGRMSQLGQLTATVAHELRNPLGAVRTSAFLLERKVTGKDLGIEPLVQRINSGVARCDNIITQLLDFARTRKLDLEKVDFDDWLAKLVQEEAQELPGDVHITCELGLGESRVDIDCGRMNQVVSNLLANAAEAMVGKGAESERRVTGEPLIRFTTRHSARGVEVVVADNGPGILPEHMEKIFEPMFTTKSFGTGLGLPTVRKIMEQHGGGIEVASQAGHGTTFTLWFPASQPVSEAA